MKNKLILLFTYLLISNFCKANTLLISQKQALINSIFSSNTFLISEKLNILFGASNIKTSFDKLTLSILINQKQGFTSIQKLDNLYWFKGNVKANRLELQAYLDYKSGIYYSAQAQYKLALASSLTNPIKEQRILILENLAMLNYLQNNLANAYNYYSLLLDYPISGSLFIKCTIQKSKIALAKGDIKLAENLIYKTALPLSNRMTNKSLLFESFLTLSQIYLKSKSYTQSKWFAILALDLAQKKGLKSRQIIGLIALAKVKSQTGDYDLAQQNLESAQQLCAKNSIYLADVYQTYSINSKRMGKQNLAKVYDKKFLTFKNYILSH